MDAQTGAHREVTGTGLAQHSVGSLHTLAMICSQGLGFIWDLGSIRKRNCRASQSVRGPNTTAHAGVQAPHSQWELHRAGLDSHGILN